MKSHSLINPTATDTIPPGPGGNRHALVAPPDPEVCEKKPRRKFTARYKLHILEQADSCTAPWQLGALLRREGLYSSNLQKARPQKQARKPAGQTGGAIGKGKPQIASETPTCRNHHRCSNKSIPDAGDISRSEQRKRMSLSTKLRFGKGNIFDTPAFGSS